MKASDYTWDNASVRLIHLFGFSVVWWRSTEWDDGYFHPPILEISGPKHGVTILMGRPHQSDIGKQKWVKYA